MSSTNVHSKSISDLTAYPFLVKQKEKGEIEFEVIKADSKVQALETTRKGMQSNGPTFEIGPVKEHLPLKDEKGNIVARVDKSGRVLTGNISKISAKSKKEMEEYISGKVTEQVER